MRQLITKYKNCAVSTIKLSASVEEAPEFETMVFMPAIGGDEVYSRRTATEREAKAEHARICYLLDAVNG